MIYEIRFDKNPTIQVVNGKKKLVWVPRYTGAGLAVLAANAEAGLGDKFVAFSTADEPTTWASSIGA